MRSERVSPEQSIEHKGKKTERRKARRRHIPQRTCVGCRTAHPKREMVRVVRAPEGSVEIDPSGKRAGRGAYLCRQRSCWEKALKRHSLNRALRTILDDATQAALTSYAGQLGAHGEAQTLSEDSET